MVEHRNLLRAGAGLALLLLAACGSDKAGEGGPGGRGGRRPPQLVAAMAVPMEDYAPTLIALGTVTPRQSVAVRPRADGQIESIAFAEGDFVRAGQVLFRLDRRQAEAAVAQARAQLASAVASELQARADFERAQALVGKGFISGTVLDQRRAAAEGAQAQIASARAQVKNVETQLSFLTVTAPISGRTGELQQRLGANVRQGDAALVTINQLSPIHVRFLVPAADIAATRAVLRNGGGRVVAKTQVGGEVLSTGKLVFLDNNVDPGNGGVTARAEFSNQGDVLWPGAVVNVEFPLAAPTPHLTVPEGAVQTGRDAPFVWAVTKTATKPAGAPNADAGPDAGAARGAGATVHMREVVVAGRLGGKVYLTSGIKQGDQVVVDALAKLKDGDAVRVKRPDGGKGGGAQMAGRAGAVLKGPAAAPASGADG